MKGADLIAPFLSGALSTGYLLVALFFLRFWRETHERLFGYFATAFVILAFQRALLAFLDPTPLLYLLRLGAFTMILWAIIDKNRGMRRVED